jgi:hypothetical protein
MSLLILQILGEGSLERRILEVNRKRVKVVKPGSKTSFPTTEIRGSYAPPFHVSLCQNFISFVTSCLVCSVAHSIVPNLFAIMV